jgi:hypothetical protein
MDYSRRDFLRIAAVGLPVAGASWFYSGAAHASEEIEGAYSQTQADSIHSSSMEEAIRQAGEKPAEVKARADSRLLELWAGSVR